jgi:4a-hydroxytetrahydrobiopterin dehydratase
MAEERLTEQKCAACEGGVSPLARTEAEDFRAQVDEGWQLTEDAREIRREFRFRNFYHTIAFVNAVAWIANREDHHPDLEVGYNRCLVRFSTHSIGGLSRNDFICAAKIDAILI